MRSAAVSDEELLARAQALLSSAHSPYSGVAVAAVVLADDGRLFGGVNVENTSLGLTVCAERNALGQAVAAGAAGRGAPGRRIVAIAFTSNDPNVSVPCGACRQVIAELAPAARIVYGRDGRVLTAWADVHRLLPEAFDGTWKENRTS